MFVIAFFPIIIMAFFQKKSKIKLLKFQNSNDSNVNNDSNVTEQFLVGDLMQQKYFS